LIGEWVDKAISVVAPGWAAQRAFHRNSFAEQIKVRELKGGRMTRATARAPTRSESGNLNQTYVANLRSRAWDLFQNNPHANKAVRIIVSQTIGTGLIPESSAVDPRTGQVWDEFKARARELWNLAVPSLCYEGTPGRGGDTLHGMAKMALQENIIVGEVLTKFIRFTGSSEASAGRPVPLAVSLAESERLADLTGWGGRLTITADRKIPDGGLVYRGVEKNAGGQRTGYYVSKAHPNDPANPVGANEFEFWPVKDTLHTYVKHRPTQDRGWSWFSTCNIRLLDIDTFQENELQSSTGAACIAMGIKKARPSASGFNPLSTQVGTDVDTVDADGNKITHMQPGMIVPLGPDDDLVPFNPLRPTTGADVWAIHLLRGVAAGLPGMKASSLTLTFDKSYSAERAADNDCWREVEQLQEWFAQSWYQPIYAEVIKAGILTGWFNSLPHQGIADDVFIASLNANVEQLSLAAWHGPYQKAINPAAEENASKIAIMTGTSSLPVEAAARGLSWKENIDQQAAVVKYAMDKAAELQCDPAWIMANLTSKPAQPEGKPAVRSDGHYETNGRLNGVLFGAAA